MDTTNIELEPLSTVNAERQPRPSSAKATTGWLAIGLAVAVAAGTLGAANLRDTGTQTPAVQPRVEKAVAALPVAAAGPPAASALERYQACLPAGAGSADAQERRGVNCRHELERALFSGDRSDPCVPRGAGSADGMERWVERCRRQVIGALLTASRGTE